MLKVFQYSKSSKHVPFMLNTIIFLMMCSTLLFLFSSEKNEENKSQDNFILELKSNLQENNVNALLKQIQDHPHVIAKSAKMIKKESALKYADLKLDQSIVDNMIDSGVLKDVIQFQTKAIEEGEKKNAFKDYVTKLDGIQEVVYSSLENPASLLGSDYSNKLKPIAVILILLLTLLVIFILKSELQKTKSEIRMLSLSGVSDHYLINKLNASITLKLIKSWFLSVLLFLGAFYLIFNLFLKINLQFSIQDIIVALIFPFIFLLISMSLYARNWASHLIKRI